MKRFLLIAFTSITCSISLAAQIHDNISLPDDEESMTVDKDGRCHLFSEGALYTEQAGAPELPYFKRVYFLPYNLGNFKLNVTKRDSHVIIENYTPYPSQGPQKVEKNDDRELVELDEKYNKSTYPNLEAEIVSHDVIMGYHLITVASYPYYYDGESHALYKRNVSYSLDYSLDESIEIPKMVSLSSYKSTEMLLKNMVDNPDDVRVIQGVEQDGPSNMVSMHSDGTSFPCNPKLVILTSSELSPVFQTLALWKTKTGIPTIIETTEYINSHYLGNSLCEKIRKYIKEKEELWGIGISFLLGGDDTIIPSWKYVGHEFNEVTDVYYVSGEEWNPYTAPNSTSINSYIGRFPVCNSGEASILINKIIHYEKADATIDYSYLNNNLIASAYITRVENDFSNGGMSSIYNITHSIPWNFWYQFDFFNLSSPAIINGSTYTFTDNPSSTILTGEDLTRQNFLRALQDGAGSWPHFHIVYHLDHCERMVMGTSDKYLKEHITSSDIDALDFDESYYQIVVSGGCHPADFRTPCIAKSFLMHNGRGAVAFVGNVDVGWAPEYSQGNKLFTQLSANDTNETESQMGQIWLSLLEAGSTKKCRLHLLGDPSMRIWTSAPQSINISKSQSGNNIILSRSLNDVGKPWDVCAYKENELYVSEPFVSNTMQISTADVENSGYVYLTYTGPNYRPVIDSIYVNRPGSDHIEITDILIDDNQCNGDGQFTSGETLRVSVTMKNVGTLSLLNFKGQLQSTSPYVTILDDEVRQLIILPNGSVHKDYIIRILPSCPDQNSHNNNSLRMKLHLTDDDMDVYKHFNVDVYQPKAVISQYKVIETSHTSTYNYELFFDVANDGVTTIENPTFRLTTNSVGVTITSSMFQLGSISPNMCGGSHSFSFSSSMPFANSNIIFSVNMADENGWSKNFTLTSFSSFPSQPTFSSNSVKPGGNHIDILLPSDSYKYYVYKNSTGGYIRLNNMPISSRYYRDDGLISQTTYTYKISRVSNQGVESNPSSPVSATTRCQIDEQFAKHRLAGSKAFVGSLVCWDVDRDGKMEMFSNYRNWLEDKESFIAFNSEGNDLFINNDPKMLEDCDPLLSNGQNGPAIGELFDDGEQYVLMSTYNENNLTNYAACYSMSNLYNNCAPERKKLLSGTGYNSPRSIVIDDLNQDGICEIIIPSINQIQICSNSGSVMSTINAFLGYKTIATAKVLPNQANKQIIAPIGADLKLYDMQANQLMNMYHSTNGNVTSPVACDVDGDGCDEIFFGQFHNETDTITIMYADIDNYGSPVITNLFTTMYRYPGRNDCPLSLGDLNNDGIPELVCYGLSQMVIYDITNNQTITRNLSPYKGGVGYTIIADVDGDNTSEIVYSRLDIGDKQPGEVCAIHYDGTFAPGFPFGIDERIGECFLAADIDGDNKTELVIGENCGQMSMWRTNGNAENIEWGTARGNAQNTGSYEHTPYPERVLSYTNNDGSTKECDVYVVGNALNVNNTLNMDNHKVIVWDDGVLNLNNASINDTKMIIKNGGEMNISNNGEINLGVNRFFKVDEGGKIRITAGKIQ